MSPSKNEYYVFYERLWFDRAYMRTKTFLKPGLKSSLKLTGLNRINPVKGGVYWKKVSIDLLS